MPRIRPITVDEAEPQVRAAMERNLEVFGRVLPSTEVTGTLPECKKALAPLTRESPPPTNLTRASIIDERTRGRHGRLPILNG